MDIFDAIYEIRSFVKDLNFPDFQDDPKTMCAVELDKMIIGESANAFPEKVQQNFPEIPW